MKFDSIINRYFSRGRWLMSEQGVETMLAILTARMEGIDADPALLAELRKDRQYNITVGASEDEGINLAELMKTPSAEGRSSADSGGKVVAIMPLIGPVMARAGWLEMCGYVDPHSFATQIDAFADDPRVHSIILNIDSPGGTVSGTGIAGSAVARAAEKKRVVAVVNDGMYSAALWIGSQATEVVMAPGAELGSIGVIATHVDQSEAAAQAGVKFTYVRSTPGKARGQRFEAMDEATLEDWMGGLQAIHDEFVHAVAVGREMTDEEAAKLATGATWRGQAAIDAGLADRIATLSEIIREELDSIPQSATGTRGRDRKGEASMPQENQEAQTTAAEAGSSSTTATPPTTAGSTTATAPALTPEVLRTEHAEVYQGVLSLGAAAERSRIAGLLGVQTAEGLTDQNLTELRARAADGTAYREALLGDLRTECIRLHGAQDGPAAGDLMVTAFQNQSIENLQKQVALVRKQADASVPEGRKSKPSSGTPKTDSDTQPIDWATEA